MKTGGQIYAESLSDSFTSPALKAMIAEVYDKGVKDRATGWQIIVEKDGEIKKLKSLLVKCAKRLEEIKYCQYCQYDIDLAAEARKEATKEMI